MWNFFKKFPPHRLQDTNFQIHRNPFFGPMKNQATILYKLTFVWKNVQNGGASLGIILQGKFTKCLKNFKSFGIVQYIRKK